MRTIFPWICRFVASAPIFLSASAAYADGGTLRLSKVQDGRTVSVFTAPSPPVAGIIDISVLVQDARSGKTLFDLPVTIHARGPSGQTVEAMASQRNATNQLMQAAMLEMSGPGDWSIDVTVDCHPFNFDLAIGEPPPPWRELIGWFLWPTAAIGIFVFYTCRNSP